MSITISAKNVRHLEHEYAACQQLKPGCAYSAWSSAQYSLGLSILKCFEPRKFSSSENSTKNMFDVAINSAGATIALAISFDENHPPENIIDG